MPAIKQNIKIILSSILVVAVMVTIFIFSSQNGDSSSSASDGFGELVLDMLDIEVPAGQTASDVEIFAGFKIRNFAHMFLYFCLGVSCHLLASSLWGIKISLKPSRVLFSALCAFGVSLLYACTDEWHQYYVPGRTATVRDVLIDCIGITLSVVLVSAVQLIIYAVKNSRRSQID